MANCKNCKMTDEYCASGDCSNDTLMEQWKKGELPSGEYYIIDDLGLHTTDRYYPSHGFGTELPQSVLGRVPSYEEWQASEKWKVLLNENTKLKELLKEVLSKEKPQSTIELFGKIEQLQKQLEVAVEALEKYAAIRELYFIAPDGSKITLKCNDSNWSVAKEALQQIEDLK